MDRAYELAKKLHEASMSPADLLKQQQYSSKQLFLIAYASFLLSISNKNTRQHYKSVIDQFVYFMHNVRDATPLKAVGVDISLWRDDLFRTGGVASTGFGGDLRRCAPQARSSIENKTSILSAFFTFLQKPGMDGSAALISSNPVDALHTRFKIEKYGNSKKISMKALKAILNQIDVKTLKRRIEGLRNYTLIYGYFMTGRRNSEWVNLRWGDINFTRNPPTYSFIRKGQKDTVDEMPPEVLEALLIYLKERWGSDYERKLRPDSYLFTAMPGKGGKRQVANDNNPLTERYMLRIIKNLARKAGIPASQITVHSLRHLHAESYLKAGASVEEVRARLRHESLATTQRYVSTMQNEKNRLADKLDDMLKKDV